MTQKRISRRGFGALSVAASLSACQPEPQRITGYKSGNGFVLLRGGDVIAQDTFGLRRAPVTHSEISSLQFTPQTPFRAASMSKIVVALTARAMAAEGTLSWDMDISRALGQTMRHPDYPNAPITFEHLISHRSLITDPAVYWIAAPGDIRSLLTDEIFIPNPPQRPGGYFTYANLNYGLAATVMEAVSGERFDRLTQKYVLGPLGLDAGFNWSGVTAKTRKSGASLYGQDSVVDAAEALNDGGAPVLLSAPEWDIDSYEPGTNGTLFSPQGGLRASLMDLARLAEYLGAQTDMYQPDWLFNGANGNSEDGHFLSFGRGCYLYPAYKSPLPGRNLIGHVGQAYGMVGGLWSDGVYSFAFADLNASDYGAAMMGGQPNISRTAHDYFKRISAAIRDNL